MMEKIILNNIVSTMSFNDKIREYKVSPVIIYSQLDDAKLQIFLEKNHFRIVVVIIQTSLKLH